MNDATLISSSPGPSAAASRIPAWVLLGGVLLPLLYLPTLTTRFDFIDDGNLVYATKPLPLAERAHVVWQKVVSNYEDLGPFRPVLWVHWELAADLLQGSELGWRITRMVWCIFATTMLLWLLAELRLPRLAALIAGAVAMWNPYRNEIWTSLSLSEGVAMPYAILALICSRRALNSRTPVAWDLLGAGCVLAALGCKNTFAALIPAQVFLRMVPDGMTLRQGWQRHGRRALLLGLTLLAPAVHYVYFQLHWHPGQYRPVSPSLAQFRRILSSLFGAMSVDLLGAGLILAVVAQIVAQRSANTREERLPWYAAARLWMAGLCRRYRAALMAAVLLLGSGMLMYLPMDAMSGRYTMPAVWGLDLILAVVLSGLVALPRTRWVRAAGVGLAVGLLAVMVSNLGKQQKFAARADVLWQALEWVERHAPANCSVAWICSDNFQRGLNFGEGVHFQWHLAARGRADVHIILSDEHGHLLQHRGLSTLDSEPVLAIWDAAQVGCGNHWQAQERWLAYYWAGRKQYECCFGPRRRDDVRSASKARLPD